MEVMVSPAGWLAWRGGRARCALGRGGARVDKREGDGATPVGRFPFRRLLYRADRLPPPVTRLPTARIREDDGWCDAPEDPRYNRQIRLPYGASHERLWRADGIYDLVIVIGHNDAPAVPFHGSAIFMHLARPDYAPTEGCIALARPDLLALLAELAPGDAVVVSAPD